MNLWKTIILLYDPAVFRFHVNLPGRIWKFYSLTICK